MRTCLRWLGSKSGHNTRVQNPGPTRHGPSLRVRKERGGKGKGEREGEKEREGEREGGREGVKEGDPDKPF